jgi:hypothetical protein
MKARLWLLLGLIVTLATWLYVHRILGPWRHYVNVETGTMKADLGDLYTPWVASRELLIYKRNPYSPEVTHEIQMAFYGRIITQPPNAPASAALDEQRFAYPVYAIFFLAPTIHWTFAALQTWALVVLALLTAIGVLLWFDTLRWLPSRPTVAAVVLFTLSTPPIVQGLRLRQLGLLAGFLLALAAWCVSRNHLWAVGVVLAFSTIKPQMTVLPLLWFLCWALGDWQKRWPLITAFVATLSALIGAGELLLPGWPRYFLEGLHAYRKYTYRPPLFELALGNIAGEILSGVVFIGLLGLAWHNRKEAGDSRQFTMTLAIFLMASMLTMPLLPLFNQLLLILPVMIVLRDWESLRTPARYTFIAILAWPSVTSAILLFLFSSRPYPSNRILLLPSLLALFLPFILPLLLLRRDNLGIPGSSCVGHGKST